MVLLNCITLRDVCNIESALNYINELDKPTGEKYNKIITEKLKHLHPNNHND